MTGQFDPVTPSEVAFYRENGYIQYPSFFSAEEIAPLSAAIDHAVAAGRDRILGVEGGGRHGEAYERVFNQMLNLWTDYPDARAVTFNRRLSDTARRLSGSGHVRLYHDHAMVKPAGQASRQTQWHQDAPFWPMDSLGSLAAWIAVDDVTMENGCMQFVPGSHRFGKLADINPYHLEVEGESILDRMGAMGHTLAEPVAMEMEAGGVTFHHSCTFHRAGPNLSDHPRRAFSIIYVPEWVRFTGEWNAGSTPAEELEVGSEWDHPNHPILSPA